MSFFGNLAKAVIDTAMMPVEAVKDVATLGGASTDEGKSFMVKRAKKVCEDLEYAYDDLD